MDSSTLGDSIAETWEHQQQSPAFLLLDPPWWGYILGSFLPYSSLYTLKQVCKAWRDLTASPYYTRHAPLRVTTKLLGRLASCSNSLVPLLSGQSRRMLEQVSKQCGGRISLGLPRTAVEFHGVVIELLNVTGPVQQITVSVDTNYIPVVGALHELILRSRETLVELKLRGARLGQQLCAILQESLPSGAALALDDEATFQRKSSHSPRGAASDSGRRLLLLPQLRVLETDNVYVLRHLEAPRLVSLFVDYNSVPLQLTAPCVSFTARRNCGTNDNNSPDIVPPATAENTITAMCHWLSEESNGFPRLVLLEFLARSGASLQRLTQAVILPVWPYPRMDESLLQDKATPALLHMQISLPNLKELCLSDVSLLAHLQTANLSMLALELPQVAVLPVLFHYQGQQQLAAQLQQLVLRLSPHKPTVAPTAVNAVRDDLHHSITQAVYSRIHGRLRSSPLPSSSYGAIGLNTQNRVLSTQAHAQKGDKTACKVSPWASVYWEYCGSEVTESRSRTNTPGATDLSPSLNKDCAPGPSPGEQQQESVSGVTVAAGQLEKYPQQLRNEHGVKRGFTATAHGSPENANQAHENHTQLDAKNATTQHGPTSVSTYDTDACSLPGASKIKTTYMRDNAAWNQAGTSPVRRHRTWASKIDCSLYTDACSPTITHRCRVLENICLWDTCEAVCAAAFDKCLAEAANAGRAASAASPWGSSPAVVLLNLTHLTAPWSLLGLLVCPNLRQLHVTGMIQRATVLNFLQAAAPWTECLLIDKMHIDFKVERAGEVEYEQKDRGGVREKADVFAGGEKAVTWRLLLLKEYKGPAALLSDDVHCPNLEYLEVTDEDTTGELARFLFAKQRRCPRLKRLSLRSLGFAAAGVAEVIRGRPCPSQQTAEVGFFTESTTTQAAVPEVQDEETTASWASPFVTPVAFEATSCAVPLPADTRGRRRADQPEIVSQAPFQRKRNWSRMRPSANTRRCSWFDSLSTAQLHAHFSVDPRAGIRGCSVHGPPCVYTATEAQYNSATPSVTLSQAHTAQSVSTPVSRQCSLEALHVSRLNARQVAEWLPTSPPLARVFLTQVKKLYIDSLEEGRRAMARLLAAMPMLEYVEIHRSAGMTEKSLTACFAFRGFQPCHRQLLLHRSAHGCKHAAQWCFIRQKLRERCTWGADMSQRCAPMGIYNLVPLARRKCPRQECFRDGPREGRRA